MVWAAAFCRVRWFNWNWQKMAKSLLTLRSKPAQNLHTLICLKKLAAWDQNQFAEWVQTAYFFCHSFINEHVLDVSHYQMNLSRCTPRRKNWERWKVPGHFSCTSRRPTWALKRRNSAALPSGTAHNRSQSTMEAPLLHILISFWSPSWQTQQLHAAAAAATHADGISQRGTENS